MQENQSFFKKKVIPFTLGQVVLLSFLLVVSVVVRVMLYPHNYLESLPLYFIVGFFFLWEMLDFFFVSREITSTGRMQGSCLVRGVLRLGISLMAGFFISYFLSSQPLFTGVLFLIFLVSEYVFDAVFYRREM